MQLLKLSFLSLLVGCVHLQDVDYAITCVTDPLGYPEMVLENHSGRDYVFVLFCDESTFEVYMDPYTTRTYQALFPWQIYYGEEVFYNCVVPPWTYMTNGIYTYAYDLKGDMEYDNATFCSNNPGVESGVQAYTSCDIDEDSNLVYYFMNNVNEDMMFGISCYDVDYEHDEYYDWSNAYFDFTLSPFFRMKLKVELFDFQHRMDATCVMIQMEHGFDLYYYAETSDINMFFQFVMDTSYFYVEGWLYCKGRQKTDDPIAEVIPHCPSSTSGDLVVELRADVPAYAILHCKNGDAHLSTTASVSTFIDGAFSDQDSDCQFYKQQDAEIYTLIVEVGWGVEQREIFLDSKMQTISCVYEEYGIAGSSVERVGLPAFPFESKTVFKNSQFSGIFDVQVLDVLGRQINTFTIASGRRIRLMIVIKATEEMIYDMKAWSCTASNGVTSYNILQHGCGDGFVIDRDDGFTTGEGVSFSPFFKIFHLRGGRNIWFDCTFTECHSPCYVHSCDYEDRRAGQPSPEYTDSIYRWREEFEGK